MALFIKCYTIYCEDVFYHFWFRETRKLNELKSTCNLIDERYKLPGWCQEVGKLIYITVLETFTYIYLFVLYSVGVTLNFALKHALKYFGSEKPTI